jgi:colanic acid/amylovoran biosynthesis glycosyltransferase
VTVEAAAPKQESRAARRVAHVVRNFGTVSQTFVTDLIRETDAAGWEAWVLTTSVQNREHFPFPPDDRIAVTVTPPFGRRAWNRALCRPVRVRRATRFEPHVRRIAPAVLHGHMGPSAVDALALSQRFGIPLLPSFHGFDLTVLPAQAQYRRDYEALFASVSRARVSSQWLCSKLRGLGFEGHVDVIPSGIRLDEFPLRRPGAEQPERPLLLFIGRLVEFKGLDVLLRALAGLPDALGARLEVIGDGPCRRENEELARSLGIAARVEFRGAQPRSEVIDALRRAQLLVAPSRTVQYGQAEALSNVIKEAEAVGTPVVATRCGGIPETIPPALRSDLVPENDHAALRDQIAALLAAPESWPERTALARSWVEENFDWRLLARRLAAVYEELADAGPRPRDGARAAQRRPSSRA